MIEFKVFVNTMYLVYKEHPLTLNFAVASADKPMATKNTAQFNLMVEDIGGKPWITS